MGDVYFFDLPVYRLAYEIYNAQRDADLAAQIASMKRGLPDYQPSRETKENMSQHQYDKYGPWRFNEIIGYIRLNFLGSQVRGEYFSAEKKRNVLSRHKVFTWRTHKFAVEAQLWHPKTINNAEIFAVVQEYVAACRKELRRRNKQRVIDDSILMTTGPHIDWRGLLGWPPAAADTEQPVKGND